MRTLIFAKRTAKEILRDPLNLAFGLGFPIVLLLLLSAIQANIPVSLFEINNLSAGISVFGLSFMTLFISLIIAKDRESAFLQRLYTTPIKPYEFICGYILPMLPISVGQAIISYILSVILGLEISVNILYAIFLILPVSLFYISVGVLFGSLLNVKAVGGICGALLTNISAFLSGIWFDLNLVGGVFKDIAYLLPFVHAVDLQKAVINGNYADILPHLLWVLAYTLVCAVIAIFLFIRQMKK